MKQTLALLTIVILLSSCATRKNSYGFKWRDKTYGCKSSRGMSGY